MLPTFGPAAPPIRLPPRGADLSGATPPAPIPSPRPLLTLKPALTLLRGLWVGVIPPELIPTGSDKPGGTDSPGGGPLAVEKTGVDIPLSPLTPEIDPGGVMGVDGLMLPG